MKVRLNVLGRKLKVATINYSNEEITDVMTVDEGGKYSTYYDESRTYQPEGYFYIDLKKALEFPDVATLIEENENKLIEHLVAMHEEECEELTGIAIDAMENKDSEPFNNQFIDSQKEYKLKQQRIFGIMDTIEEVRIFQESNNQLIEVGEK